MEKIKTIVVDDSPFIRQLLSGVLSSDSDIEVLATAEDPYAARELIKELNPDVLTLDVEMPKMDGISFLKNIMRLRPMPVVMISSLTEQGADITIDALSIGAVDFIQKPTVNNRLAFDSIADDIIDKVKMAYRTRPMVALKQQSQRSPISSREKKLPAKYNADFIAIGASTGGVEAIQHVLSNLPNNIPGIVITQHIPPVFSRSFAKRLNEQTHFNVYEAEHGQDILPGCVYIAPGDKHLEVRTKGSGYICVTNNGSPVNRHRPSVDVLFNSIANNTRSKVIGVLLTGMGEDGARGLKTILEHGAYTIAQNKESSVVWGMPGAAANLNAANELLSLSRISARIVELIT